MADEQKPKTKSFAARKDRVRLTLLVYRKPGMSLDEFHQYWKNQHAELFSSIAIVKKNLLSYVQMREACAHVNEEASAQLKQVGFPVSDADGMAIFEAPSYAMIAACFQDEEYQKIVVPDEENFLDRGRCFALAAELVPVLDDAT
ncbi:hypothetical protein HO173_012492 [Letharia columbiana]|uniref:EthD domain-containing protein n=1 Tax=Letharia columbiana TaxID=112416 RepID=A0A8H6FG40_9LECA|nr:uncharacterized protein HO173_012492 [Letharia columbiana]KAF6226593.1 hypothetical protein HO173_012492 [Letharia columbiana]